VSQVVPVRKAGGSWQEIASATGFPNLTYAFDQVKKTVSTVFPKLAKTGLFIGCPHSMKKHSHHQLKDTDRSGKNWRAFMHTGHFDDSICVHPHAEKELGMHNLIGMLFHEFGHMINDILGIPNTQKNADAVIERYFNMKIKYEQPGRVQYVDLG
jgi:hypothetical protein